MNANELVISTANGTLLVNTDEIETKGVLQGVIALRKTTPGEGPSVPSLAQRLERLEATEHKAVEGS